MHITKPCLDFLAGKTTYENIEPEESAGRWNSACGAPFGLAMNARNMFDKDKNWIAVSPMSEFLVTCPNCIKKMKEAGL